MATRLNVGIDIGSTTVKVVVLDSCRNVLYADYRRHNMNIRETVMQAAAPLLKDYAGAELRAAVTGSVGMGYAEFWELPFVQEVIAAAAVVERQYPQTRTFIDIGGEDSKMIFFKKGLVPDIRMNGSCAGGTGAFIDQTAGLLNVTPLQLDALASKAVNVYPIASRCGVFSKTDIQNLLARHVSREDVAVSVFHAVALQVIGTLSRGLDVEPPVFFCGGPFAFLPELKKAFLQNLHLTMADCVPVGDARVIPATGAALMAGSVCGEWLSVEAFGEKLLNASVDSQAQLKNRLAPLFADKKDFDDWKRHKQTFRVPRVEWGQLSGDEVFLGVDSGSTTTKVVVLDRLARVLYTDYRSNNGNSFDAFLQSLHGFRKTCAANGRSLKIVGSAVTGYGENLLKTAFGLHNGVVETLAHYIGAQSVSPDVTFILDIGGQDMKAIFVENHAIRRLEINEACSSGCGSFIETFANMLDYSVADFAEIACKAKHPYDLGTRCTVFMNSKVKQAMREGTSPEDISAGFAYSVIKNCLFKVLKLRKTEELGDHIVVQGGTFKNLAVVRALEVLTGCEVRFSDIPELMGAYGCALFAMRQPARQALSVDDLLSVRQFETRPEVCPGCENHCTVTEYRFSNGNSYYSGNNCEKIYANHVKTGHEGANQHALRNRLLFRRPVLPVGKARLAIGIPRALGMFELYPFWHAMFKTCGFTTVLSAPSTMRQYEKGIHTVMSENICFPAKLMHGHVYDLAARKVDRIFYPFIVMEAPSDDAVRNSYNCPIVAGYSDVIKSAVDTPARFGIPFDGPVVSLNDMKLMRAGCRRYLRQLGIGRALADKAVGAAVEAQNEYHRQLHDDAVRIVEEARKNGRMVVVLAGRPYHSDPLVQHKISECLTGMGIDVVTEFVAGDDDKSVYGELAAVTQWTYPNRIFKAAHYVAGSRDNVHFMMLTSFGCGPDAFIIDEVHDILNRKGKSFTLLKVDDVNNVGSLRLRVRSMVESLKYSRMEHKDLPFATTKVYRRDDRRKTILVPYFADGYSEYVPVAFKMAGYHAVNLPMGDRECVDLGLKYVNNEVCYPATIVVGSILKALRGGKYDVADTAVMISQTGGQCRATNYIMLIKKALVEAGFAQIPVISMAFGKTLANEQPGFSIDERRVALPLINALLFADCLSRMYFASCPRELRQGAAKELRARYVAESIPLLEARNYRGMKDLLKRAARDFTACVDKEKKLLRIGVVGEIFVKYNGFAHMNILDWLSGRGVEVVAPSLYNFFMNSFVNRHINKELHIKKVDLPLVLTDAVYRLLYRWARSYDAVCAGFPFYRPFADMFHDARLASRVINMAANFGEGWLIPAELCAMAEEGIENVVSLQPFACISNHIIAKGIEKRVRELYPRLNLLFLDFDGGTSEANVFNRLHFMIENGLKSVSGPGGEAE